ncbi:MULTISPECIES: 2Fe-2S iron-sulfur cluster-binding protein [Burkholderia]|uniref:2Fe-2S iron-sulfur cluster-binding protein n=1 Tax=Burkholderia TaxID=32008 RepID=UPI000CDB8DC6|nr:MULTISPECIES: 2Fe-2S iron-sulfur cluster-binding protein [Burkholderia]NIE83794.1 2Fe-2S iron-sulfur cluster binding domain-containing protein [Burkholderia sp. Tr-860]NIF61431.1 2Fe-2S iron-sulfur cluster binding domain-containing protein [Burkholderia sp. Cy-647]NIF68824.1 2Fe-2S iron-sulfur cluster binding domain-containing protein [Burkholderia sp. Ap-962]NIF87243.1 2Fe-2S iron-sulfur cluster binding domain-containing protein [Burkholderia sp. Cy-637]NIF94441.1 2Fe-2S iron-sulfur cluste
MSTSTRHITLEGTGTRFPCKPDDTILRAAQRAGIAFPYECNVGACGNCKFQLVEGELHEHWPEAPGRSAKDRERGRFLGCQAVPGGDCTIKVRTAEQYAPVHPPRQLTARLEACRDITHDIREFRFSLETPLPFEPGQYALLSLPGVTGQRAYSMSNVADPADPSLHFQVRRVPGGAGTRTLFDTLRPGHRIEIDGPYGHAWLRRDVRRDVVCLAGGSGLAPMISIARGIAFDLNFQDNEFHFLYGGRTLDDLCGRDMLEALPGFGTRIHYRTAVSAPDASEAAGGADHVGFVHELADALLGDRLRDMEIYFAGPPAMGAAVQQMLLARQVPFDRVHFDQFY